MTMGSLTGVKKLKKRRTKILLNADKIFKKVKKLYKQRSAAVHGSEIKGDAKNGVEDSTKLLSRLIYECINNNNIPRTDDLAP